MGAFHARTGYSNSAKRIGRKLPKRRSLYEKALLHSYTAVRRAQMLAAIDTLSALDLNVEPKGGLGTQITRLFEGGTATETPEYDQRPTDSRPTTTDTSTQPQETHPMTALHNRALALKLAVEAASASELDLVESDENRANVLDLADRFVAYLGADEPNTTGAAVPSGDTASAPEVPDATAAQAVEDIRALLQASRGELGDRATTAALGQLDQLRSATRGSSYSDVFDTAISFVDSSGRSEFGSVVADRLIAKLNEKRD